MKRSPCNLGIHDFPQTPGEASTMLNNAWYHLANRGGAWDAMMVLGRLATELYNDATREVAA